MGEFPLNAGWDFKVSVFMGGVDGVSKWGDTH